MKKSLIIMFMLTFITSIYAVTTVINTYYDGTSIANMSINTSVDGTLYISVPSTNYVTNISLNLTSFVLDTRSLRENLILVYTFDNDNGSHALDQVNDKHGLLSAVNLTNVSCARNNCYNFTEFANSQIELEERYINLTNNWTISYWANDDDSLLNNNVKHMGTYPSNFNELTHDYSGNEFGLRWDSGQLNVFKPNAPNSQTSTTHHAISYNGTHLAWYIGGIFLNHTASYIAYDNFSINQIMGLTDSDNQGYLDEIYIWNVTLSHAAMLGLNSTFYDNVTDDIFYSNGSIQNLEIHIGDVDTPTEYKFLGNMNRTSEIAYLNTSKLNAILLNNCDCTNCSIVSSNCVAPLTFKSEVYGILQSELLNISYAYGLDNCTNSFGIDSNATTLNISFWDNTDTRTALAFGATFDYGLSSTYVANTSLGMTKSNFSMCIYPSWANIYSDALIDYSNQTYHLDNALLTNTTTNINLYTQVGTSYVTFTVQDYSTIPVEDAYITILRWDAADNLYKTTEILRTDSNGEATGSIVLFTDYYKFIVSYDGEVRLIDPETGGIRLFATTRTFRISTETTEYFEDLDEVQDITTSLTFNASDTNSFVFTWTNPTGTQIYGCMDVLRKNSSMSTTLFTSCDSQSSGIITTAITPINCNTFQANAYFYINEDYFIVPNSPLIEDYDCSYKISEAKQGDLDVVFFGWFLVAALALIGLPFPAISLLFGVIGLLISTLLGLWDISIGLVITIFIIGVIYVYKQR